MRVSMLSAILEKYLKVSLSHQDLYFNVAGDFRLSEPGCDLGAAAAIWSSYHNRAIGLFHVFIGELGLTGEIRMCSQMGLRILEAKRLGMKTFILPKLTSGKVLESLVDCKIQLINHIGELPEKVEFF
jgi:DNA repair protein RadA/Sms